MATVGAGLLDRSVMGFFEGLRLYNADRATADFVADAEFGSPWSGKLVGKDVVQTWLKTFLSDPAKRPSFALTDVSGDGAVTHVSFVVSGRFGQAATRHVADILVLRHKIYQVFIRPA